MSYLTDNHGKEDQIYYIFFNQDKWCFVSVNDDYQKTIWYIKIMASEIGETAFCTYITPEPH